MQALWMVLASLLFATMGVCVKIASAYFNSAELVFYRGVIGMWVMWALARSVLMLPIQLPIMALAALNSWWVYLALSAVHYS